jgi:hypothetical protein
MRVADPQSLMHHCYTSLLYVSLWLGAVQAARLLLVQPADPAAGVQRHRVSDAEGPWSVLDVAARVGHPVEAIDVLDLVTGRFETPVAPSWLWHAGPLIVSLRDGAPSPKPLELAGRRFDPSQGFVVRSATGATVQLRVEEEDGQAHQGTGLKTWDAAVVLARLLEAQAGSLVQGRRVLELGAGTGLSGLAAALVGASHVLLTDLPYTIPRLQANVAANPLARGA